MDLSPNLASSLRSCGHDAFHAAELRFDRATDAQILSKAFEDARVIITADLDFPRWMALLAAGGPGLILLRGGNYSELESLECVRRVLNTMAAEESRKGIVVVDRKRIRRRWLPI